MSIFREFGELLFDLDMDLRTHPLRFAIAVLFVAAAVAIMFVVRTTFGLDPTPVIILAIIGTAWVGGKYPGLFACLLADLASDFFFESPLYEFTLSPNHLVHLSVFAAVSLLTSSRRESEEGLRNRERQQAAVASLGKEALAGTPLEDLFQRGAELVRETLNADLTAICELAPAGSNFRFVAAAGWPENVIGQEFSIESSDSLAGRVVEHERPLIVRDLARGSYRPSEFLARNKVRSVLGVAIANDKEPLGILGAFQRTPRSFSVDDANFLSSIANIIAEAAGRLRAEMATAEQKTWLETTLSSIGDGVIATNRDGSVNFMNGVAQRLTGWDEASARGLPLEKVFRIVNEETFREIDNPVEKVLSTGEIVGLANHTLLLSRDGSRIPITDSAAPIRNRDEIIGVVLVFADASERKKAEHLMSRRAREIAALYEFTDRLQRATSMPDVYEAALDSIDYSLACDRASVLLYDETHVMRFVGSRGLSEGYRQAASGHSPWKYGEKGAKPIGISNVEDAEIDPALKAKIISEGIAALGFIPLISNEELIGKLMIYFDSPHTFTESEFEIAMTVANQIAAGVEQKRTETRLIENEERLRLATQAGKVGVWDWDIRSNRVEWTDALYPMHGLEKGQFDGSVETFSNLVHPDDRGFVAERIEKALSGEEPYDLEFRVIRADGRIAWLFTNARVLRDAKGPYRMIGATTDFTEQKVSDEASARLAAVVNSSRDAIISKDLDGIITSWNRGAEELFGYAADEAIGKSVTMLIPEDRIDEEPSILKRIRRGEPVETYETVRRRKDGSPVAVSLSVSPVFDRHGRIIGASKIARDITEQKQADAARRESEIMQRLVEAQESDRHRIARDLHDHLGQRMTGLRLKLEAVVDRWSEDPDLKKAIDEVQDAALQIDRDIGFLSWELRPTELDNLGLTDALRSFVREWSSQYGIGAEFHSNLGDAAHGDRRLPQVVETNIYRIVQEGLNNILKHANARNVDVLLQQQKDQLVLVMEDDGSGFVEGNGRNNGNKGRGLGLIGMSERAALLKGSLEIESQPGEGTTLLVRVPLGAIGRTADQSN